MAELSLEVLSSTDSATDIEAPSTTLVWPREIPELKHTSGAAQATYAQLVAKGFREVGPHSGWQLEEGMSLVEIW